jgi:CHRD domain/PEP-CTERM motif
LNTFDLTLDATYNGTFLTANGGSAAGAEAALVAALFAGDAYANIHNEEFPGGEIRGQLTAETPEPASFFMMAGALAGMAFMFLRKR